MILEWLKNGYCTQQVDAELTDWTAQEADTNYVKNTWVVVQTTMQGTWPVLRLRDSNALWTLLSDDGHEFASHQHYIQSINNSMMRQM